MPELESPDGDLQHAEEETRRALLDLIRWLAKQVARQLIAEKQREAEEEAGKSSYKDEC